MRDLIGRQAAIDALMSILDRENHAEFLYTDEICNALEALPSAQPEHATCYLDSPCEYQNANIALPSAQPEPCDDPRADVYYLAEKIGIHQLYALVVELRGEPEPCEDAVSRKDVVKFLDDWMSALNANCHHQSMADLKIIKNDFENLPSAQPEPEIIACGDCKHYICHARRCGYWNHGVKPLEWCCHGEERNG